MRRKILSLKNIIYGLGRNYEGSGLRGLIQTPRGNAFSVRNNVMFFKEIKLYTIIKKRKKHYFYSVVQNASEGPIRAYTSLTRTNNAMKKYGDIEYRAGRYIMNVHLHGQGFMVARENTKLPHILAAVINKVIFTEDRQLRVELGKLKQYIKYCIDSYREYYRSKMRERYESAHQ